MQLVIITHLVKKSESQLLYIFLNEKVSMTFDILWNDNTLELMLPISCFSNNSHSFIIVISLCMCVYIYIYLMLEVLFENHILYEKDKLEN